MSRYEVGCAGQFVTGQTSSYDDLDVAIAACTHPPGCDVYDRSEKLWLGPTNMQEIEAAQARVDARKSRATA
jgi:hypothetical protein